jgi:hypothetical protein
MPAKTTTSSTTSEAAARLILGSRTYDIFLHHYSIGRLSVKMALADSNGNTRRGDALHHLIQRKRQEGRD